MIHEIIQKRRSTVLFSGKPLEETVIDRLFEAARWAPSSMNIQPWRFVYVMKEDPGYPDLLACLTPANQLWAANAPLLIVPVAQLISDYKNRPNAYAWHDTAMAYSNLVFQAVHEGLAVHPMGGFDRDKTLDVLHIPERYEPVLVAAVGYRDAETSRFAPELITREQGERKRRSIDEIRFRGRFING